MPPYPPEWIWDGLGIEGGGWLKRKPGRMGVGGGTPEKRDGRLRFQFSQLAFGVCVGASKGMPLSQPGFHISQNELIADI